MTSPLSSPKIERNLLLHLLKNSEQLTEFEINEQFFTNEHYQQVFLGTQEMFNDGKRANLSDVLTALKRKKITIHHATAKSLQAEPEGDISEAYKTLSYLYKARETLKIAQSTVAQVESEEPEKIDAVIERATEELDILSQEGQKTQITHISEDLKAFMEEVENPSAQEKGIQTHFKDFDFLTDGLRSGNIYIVLARPGVGKSALLQNIALNIAMNGTATALISLEMTKKEVIDRMIAIYLGKPVKEIRRRQVDKGIEEEVQGMSDIPLTVIEDAMNHANIEQKLSFIKRKTNCEVFLIDFIGMIGKRNGRDMNLYNAVGEIIEKLKNFSMRENVPIVLASQQNRDSVAKGGKLNLSAIAESDKVSQFASFVVSLWDKKEEEGESSNLFCTVLKNRHGWVRPFELKFDRETQKIAGIDDLEPPKEF